MQYAMSTLTQKTAGSNYQNTLLALTRNSKPQSSNYIQELTANANGPSQIWIILLANGLVLASAIKKNWAIIIENFWLFLDFLNPRIGCPKTRSKGHLFADFPWISGIASFCIFKSRNLTLILTILGM